MCTSSTADALGDRRSGAPAARRGRSSVGRSRFPPAASASAPTAATSARVRLDRRAASRSSTASRYSSSPAAARTVSSALTRRSSSTVRRADDVERDDRAAEQAEADALEARPLEQRGEVLRLREAAHARREVRVGLAAGQHLPEQRHDPVEPEREERPQGAARPRDLEDREPPARAQHATRARAARPRGRRRCARRSRRSPRRTRRPRTAARAGRPATHSTVSDFRRARSSIRGREVEAGDDPALALGRDREVAGAAAGVEHAVAGLHDGLDRQPPPARSRPGGHDAVHRVVDRRDPVEHAPRTAVGRERARSRSVSGCAPPPDERVVDPELVEAAGDDEVDEVVDRSRRRGRSPARRRGSPRPRRSSVARPRRWIDESGVSRGTSTSLRRSLSATEAARWMRFVIAPEASVPTVDIEHGQTTYASTCAEPLAYGLV